MSEELALYERRLLQALTKTFQLEAELASGIAEDLNSLRRLYREVVSATDPEFKAGRVVVLGWINHAHCLLIGGLNAVLVGNAPVWSSCMRGLVELLGASLLVLKKPHTAPNYLGQSKRESSITLQRRRSQRLLHRSSGCKR